MSSEPLAAIPQSVTAVRALMYVVAALAGLVAVAFLVGYGATAYNLGVAIWQAIPGVASLILASKIRGGTKGVRRGIIILQVFWILFALGRLGQGDPTGLLGLILPTFVLVLINRKSARRYFGRQ
jgi:hypothetical protein